MPTLLFADAPDGVSLPPWALVLLALTSSTGPVYVAVKGLVWVWRQYRGDTVEDQAARAAREDRHETAALKTLRDQVKDLKERHDADRAECEERAERLEAQINSLIERLIRKEGRWQRLVGWVVYLQSMLAAHAPDLKFERYVEDPADAPQPTPPPALPKPAEKT